VSRGYALLGGDDLKVGSADHQDDRLSGVAGGELRGVNDFVRCAEVVPCRKVDDRLCDVAAQVKIVVRTDDGREAEAGDGQVDAQSFGGEVGLLQRLREVTADAGKQRAACDLALALSLQDGAVEVCRAEVVAESALHGLAQRERTGERDLRGTRRASRIRPLNLHGGIDGGNAVGGSGDGGFDCRDGAAIAGSTGEGKRCCLRVLRLGRTLGEGLRRRGKGHKADDDGDFSQSENRDEFCLRGIHGRVPYI